jgi:hypothetical protein
MLSTYKRSALWSILLGVLLLVTRVLSICAAILRWDCNRYLLRLAAPGRQRDSSFLCMVGSRSRGCPLADS